MTEQEWLACADPTAMLEFLHGKTSHRKMRLFACACCRAGWSLIPDPRSQRMIAVLEDAVDGACSAQECQEADKQANAAVDEQYRLLMSSSSVGSMDHYYSAKSVAYLSMNDSTRAASNAVWLAQRNDEAHTAEKAEMLVRDVVGNPFSSIGGAWSASNDGTVVKLARSIYEARELPSGRLDSSRLAILADALEEAGCTNAEILSHCRGSGPHVRGCWVVDLLLGKE
jgi:hypothetical protein